MKSIEATKCPTCGRGGKPRSHSQNSYLWGVVYPLIAEYTGHSTEELHEAFKHLFLPRATFLGDKEILANKSTTELSTVEMEDYLMRVRVWAGEELGVSIPLPNEPPL